MQSQFDIYRIEKKYISVKNNEETGYGPYLMFLMGNELFRKSTTIREKGRLSVR